MSKLSERALLVSVHRSGWSGTKVDQQASQSTRDNYHAERGAGNFTKVLVNPKFFTCVTRPMSQASSVWMRLSLPWGYNGERIMSRMAHPQFIQEMRAAKVLVEAGKRALSQQGPDIHQEARARLGDMYDPDEYPSIDEIVDRFDIDVEIKPVPEGGDFRVALSNESVKNIVKDIEARNKERLDKANKEIFKRVFNVVDTMVKTLKEYQPKTDVSKGKGFKNSLVHNVQEVAELLPTLNITADPRVDRLRDEVIDELTQVSPEILKQSDAERESAISKADKILAKIQGYMA